VCRSIKVLRGQDPPASRQDIEAAALQFIRKVSGFRQPSKANREAFDLAVSEVSAAAAKLLDHIERERR